MTNPMDEPSPRRKPKGSLRRHMVRGSIWTVAQRWSVRLMGLVNTIILARLLTPADFGIVAIASMIVGMVQVFARTGQGAAIVRHPNPTREHYDSAWTISLLLGLGLGLVIWALAPLTTAYFREPRAIVVVEILAFRTVLAGARNIGVINFRRDLQFDKSYWFNVIPPTVSFAVTVTAAFLLRNYWALVIGVMSEQFAILFLSYAMEPYRPRLCFSKVRELWSFSFWVLFRNIGVYLDSLVDRFAIGGVFGSAVMGRYYVADDIATQPSKELVGPVMTAFFPVLATVQFDVVKRRELYLSVLYASALICTSASIGIALVGDDMVDLVLGPQWIDVKPLMPWLALSWGIIGLASGIYTALDTIGLPRLSARLQWARLVGGAAIIFPVAYTLRDVESVAAARFAFALVSTPTMFLTLMGPFGLTARDYAKTLWRPMLAGLTMAVGVLALNAVIPLAGNPRLFLDVSVGAIVYGVTLLLMWHLSGRPQGPESVAWERLRASKLQWKSQSP